MNLKSCSPLETGKGRWVRGRVRVRGKARDRPVTSPADSPEPVEGAVAVATMPVVLERNSGTVHRAAVLPEHPVRRAPPEKSGTQGARVGPLVASSNLDP